MCALIYNLKHDFFFPLYKLYLAAQYHIVRSIVYAYIAVKSLFSMSVTLTLTRKWTDFSFVPYRVDKI